MPVKPATWKRRLFQLGAVLFFLLPAGLGFGNKLKELFLLVDDDEGSFTVMPLVNYLLTSLGFFFLMGWAVSQGMFRDIEKPKLTMLQTEALLDEEEEAERQRLLWR